VRFTVEDHNFGPFFNHLINVEDRNC
jgi:hypothetical protein